MSEILVSRELVQKVLVVLDSYNAEEFTAGADVMAALREAMDRAISLFGEVNVANILAAPQPVSRFSFGECEDSQAGQETPQPAQEPVAWSTGINRHPDARQQSEQVQKLTRNAQPAYGFTVALYATPQPQRLALTDEQRDSVLSDAVEMLQKQHDWLTKVAVVNLVAGLYGRAQHVLKGQQNEQTTAATKTH